MRRAAALLPLLLACNGKPDISAPTTGTGVAVGGGAPAGTFPDTEVCDGVDNDGDGEIDEGLLSTFYEDADGDGYGNPGSFVEACEAPTGYVGQPDDCDDTDPTVYTHAFDLCDAVDNDCDGLVDEDHRADWVLATVSAGEVLAIDRATGVATQRTTVDPALFDSGPVNSADSRDASFLVVHDASSNSLVELDSCTGSANVLGPHGQGNLPGIAFGHDGQIYGIDVDTDQFVRIDPNGLASQSLLALGRDVLNSGMAYDCSRQRLWVADQAAGEIFWYDALTNTTGGFVPTNVPFASVGLEYDNRTGTLLASTGAELWEIDPLTGTGTLIAPFTGVAAGNVNDLVLLPQCP